MEFRLAAAADAAGMAEIYAPIVASTPTSFEIDPPDAPEMRRRIDATLPTLPWLVCDCEGRVAGYAYASPHKTRAAYNGPSTPPSTCTPRSTGAESAPRYISCYSRS